METIKLSPNSHTGEQVNNNNPSVNSNIRNSIYILNDDCVRNVLSYIDTVEDLTNCKSLNKRFFNLIDNTTFMDKLLDNFFKNCHLQPNFFLLSIKYLQAINNQVSTTSKIAVSDDSNLNIQDTNLKKKLFFSIEKQLSAIQETKFKTIATVEHDKSINEICFSDDNNFFATASNDGTVQIYKFTDDNWQPFCSLRHGNDVKQIIFSPDSSFIITSSYFAHKIWKLSEKNYNLTNTMNNNYSSMIIFRNDSKRFFLTRDSSDRITVYDFTNNTWQSVFFVENKNLNSYFNLRQASFLDRPDIPKNIKEDEWLSFIIKRYTMAPKYNLFCDFGDEELADKTKDILHGTNWRQVDEIFQRGIKFVNYSKNMRLIYVCALHSLIIEYIDNRWKLKCKFASIDEFLDFSPDNKRILALNYYSEERLYIVSVWNINSNKAYQELILSDTTTAKFSKNGKYIIATHLNKQVTIWCFTDGAWRITSSVDYDKRVNKVFFSNYNWMVATVDHKTATISEIVNISKVAIKNNTSRLEQEIQFNEITNLLEVNDIFFSANSDCFATIKNNVAEIWHATANSFTVFATLKHQDDISGILFSPSNSHIIIYSELSTNIWELTAGGYNKKANISTQSQPYIDLKEDGKKVLIAEKNNPIKIFSLTNTTLVENLVINQDIDAFVVNEGVFIPLLEQIKEDSWLNFTLQKYIITTIAQQNSEVDMISMLDYLKLKGQLNEFQKTIQDIIYTKEHKAYSSFGLPNPSIVSYSLDNKLIYFGFKHRSCVVLENNNNQWRKKNIFYGDTSQASFSSDNQRIVTISSIADLGRMVVWNISGDIAYQELGLNKIKYASFSPNNNLLATSDDDKTVKIWSLINTHWTVKRSINNDCNPINIVFSEDSKYIAIGYYDKTVKVFQLY